jgi:hypothetical protein
MLLGLLELMLKQLKKYLLEIKKQLKKRLNLVRLMQTLLKALENIEMD